VKSPLLTFDDTDDTRLTEHLKAHGLRLTPTEARRIRELLGRNPTRVEAVLFDTLWSEHCSYKSSRAALKAHLPTEAPHVLLGPGEDAGIVYLTTHAGERWALVVGHESHNHPSQVLPFEGAATGIGGIVRDVYCMGADVIGVLDALRFGDLSGPHGERSREIANGVVDGIWHYANALGVPNLGGDAVFDRGFDDNCLVNVVAVGVARERDILRSRVPKEARETPYVFVLVGKPTDASGFGGAAFASAVLDESERESNKGAVQVPDPFLKRVLTEAQKQVMALARREGFTAGFKDLGAGGIACATSELAAAGGFGADIDLTAVSVAEAGLPPDVIACSETQERYCWVVPEAQAEAVLRIYNEDFELPHLYPGARAQVIGRVRTEDTEYNLAHQGDGVCQAAVELITEGIRYERIQGPAPAPAPVPRPPALDTVAEPLMALLAGNSLASREAIYRHYDTEVQGRAVIRPGEADAAVLVPVEGNPIGLAVSVDGNPFHAALDPYQGGAGATAEAMRNVVAVGAMPWCLTDCLNYGNPEDPEVFRQFVEGVRGIGDAARGIGLLEDPRHPVPIVSGNVSFYNDSSQGRPIPPSPIVACFGVLKDYGLVTTPRLKTEGDSLYLMGERRLELGGSAYWRLRGIAGGTPPRVDFLAARGEMTAVLEAIDAGSVVACHDISEGGVAIAAAEMALPSDLGLRLEPESQDDLAWDEYVFSESGGFLLEVPPDHETSFEKLCRHHGVWVRKLGRVEGSRELVLAPPNGREETIDLDRAQDRWKQALLEALA
jgi:phosphoribosylformylglycinamidine synthase subunit PurL